MDSCHEYNHLGSYPNFLPFSPALQFFLIRRAIPRRVSAGLASIIACESRLLTFEKSAPVSSTHIIRADALDFLSSKEDAMDKLWLYVGGIIVGTAVLIYAVLTTVSSVTPPASDLRAAYEQPKK